MSEYQESPSMRSQVVLLAAVSLLANLRSQDPVETKYESGAVHERYSLDAAGRKSGPYLEFRPDGTVQRRCAYSADVLSGRDEQYANDGKTVLSSGEYRQGQKQGTWSYFDPDSARRKKVDYKAGVVHGAVTIQVADKMLSRQKWKDGELDKLDDLTPFAIRAGVLREKLSHILTPPAQPNAASGDSQAAEREAALRRLKAYRALCAVQFEAITLVPGWNELCDAAAEICCLNGELSHTPPRPSGVNDARYRQAQEGAANSNLAVTSELPGSVDNYMDDSDTSNIGRIGHRRWCLNPSMGKTGFGKYKTYCAMWSTDESGAGARGIDAVLYPPAGWCPVDMFARERAFSISLLHAGAPKPQDLHVSIRPLDDDWLPGKSLTIDHVAVAEGEFGGSPCVVFRSEEMVVATDQRYLVECSLDNGKTLAFRYVVAFCEAVPVAENH
jgi:hypothetical protein